MIDDIAPKLFWEIRMKHKTSGKVHNMLMFPFHFRVLLGSFNTRCLMQYPKVIIQSLVIKLRSVVTPYNFNVFVKLSFHKDNEIIKQSYGLTFIFH